jgi:hypothetical protein
MSKDKIESTIFWNSAKEASAKVKEWPPWKKQGLVEPVMSPEVQGYDAAVSKKEQKVIEVSPELSSEDKEHLRRILITLSVSNKITRPERLAISQLLNMLETL